jgi:hypothetical protein
VTGLPTGSTATFSPATIAAGSAITPVTLSIQTANTQTAHNEQPTPGNPLAPVALGLLLLPFLVRSHPPMTNEEAIDSLMNSVRNLELITRSRHLQKVHRL